jgi:hypothetical protein
MQEPHMPDATQTPSAGSTPLRSAVRFPLCLDLVLRSKKGEWPAKTVNISAGGILFEAAKLPPVNSEVEFVLTMPPEVMGTPEGVTVHCRGRIVRHEQEGDIQHAAAVIDEYSMKA